MTKTSYILRHGVLAVGLPLAVLLNLVAVYTRPGGVYWSARNVFELAYTVMLIAPTAGVLAGNWRWARRFRRG